VHLPLLRAQIQDRVQRKAQSESKDSYHMWRCGLVLRVIELCVMADGGYLAWLAYITACSVLFVPVASVMLTLACANPIIERVSMR